jgi:titin
VETFDNLEYLTYEVLGLTDSVVYGFKIEATNDIGTSIESNTQYFACAEVPGSATEAPVLDASTDSSMTISWSVPAYNGGSAITGYKVFINPLDDGDWSEIYDGAGQPTILTYKIEGLKRGLHYRFQSIALNYVGEGE